MASLILNQEKSIPEADVFRVLTEVTAAEGMPEEVFVFSTDTDEYSHVAKLFDMVTFGIIAGGEQAFYRKAAVTRDFDNVISADDFASFLVTRLGVLVADYTDGAASFAGVETINIPAE